MKYIKTTSLFALVGAMVLSACNDPSGASMNNTQQGALLGAGAGALAGALSRGDGNRDEAALIGAVVGGAVGAGIGYSLDQQEADLRRDIGNENVQITNTGDSLIVNLPQDLLFSTDSFAVRPDLQADLRMVAGNLQRYPDSTVQVLGHTDSDGEADYNQQLSEQRANAVASILMNAGVQPARFQISGRGENQPVASNLSEAGKAQNRRVELVILPTV